MGTLSPEFADAFERLHHSVVLQGQRVIPGERVEGCIDRCAVEQSALLGTKPHAALKVELNGIDIGLEFPAALKGQRLLVDDLARLQVVGEISPFRGDIQQVVVNHHVVQVIIGTHDLRPLASIDVEMHEDGPLLAIADHIEAVFVEQLNAAMRIDGGIVLAVGIG